MFPKSWLVGWVLSDSLSLSPPSPSLPLPSPWQSLVVQADLELALQLRQLRPPYSLAPTSPGLELQAYTTTHLSAAGDGFWSFVRARPALYQLGYPTSLFREFGGDICYPVLQHIS